MSVATLPSTAVVAPFRLAGSGRQTIVGNNGERQRALWAAGRFDHLPALLSAQMKTRWEAGVYDGQGDRMRALWGADVFAGHAGRHRALWRSGAWFGHHRWRGGIRAELLATYPQHAAWITGLSDADLAGLLALHEEQTGDGEPLGGFLNNLLGEGHDHAAS